MLCSKGFSYFPPWAAPLGVALAVKQGWERAEPPVRRSVHISQAAHDNSCLVPAQGQACDHTRYVTGREENQGKEAGGREEEEDEKEGVFWNNGSQSK